MDDVDETDEREELFYNNVREKIVSYIDKDLVNSDL